MNVWRLAMLQLGARLLENSPQRALIGIVALAMAIAALWPFRLDLPNRILTTGSAIVFLDRAIAYTERPVTIGNAESDGGLTLVIDLTPGQLDGYGQILSFWDPAGAERIVVGEWERGLVLISRSEKTTPKDGRDRWTFAERGIDGVFDEGARIRLLLASDPKTGTSVYSNGVELEALPGFVLQDNRRARLGRLLLGNDPGLTSGWTGALHRIAVYSRAMKPAQVDAQERGPAAGSLQDNSENGSVVAVYNLGNVKEESVVDETGRSPPLQLPAVVRPLVRTFLVTPLAEFAEGAVSPRDMVINLLGFVPLGFLLGTSLSRAGPRRRRRAGWLVIAICVGLSLFFESVQVFLPDRSSSLSDLVLNSLGGTTGLALANAFRRAA